MLTDAQATTLAAHIRANTDTDVVNALAIRNDTELARLYNLDSAFIVWRESITPTEYREAMDWTEVDNLPAGKARIWEWITEQMLREYDATKANIRAGLAEAWSNGNTRDNLIAISKEATSLVESLYAAGTGTDVSPGIRVFVGNVTDIDVGKALNNNP